MESSKSVKGYTTKFDRLMALKIYDSIVYTIGVPSKTNIPKTSSVKHPIKINQGENDLHPDQKSSKEHFSSSTSSSSKLFTPQPTIENNSNSVRSLRRPNSTIINHTVDLSNMDLQHSPFQLRSTDISRLSTDPQSNNIRLIHSPAKSTSLTLLKNDVQVANSNSSQIQSTNAQPLHQNVQSTNVNFQHLQLQNNVHITSSNIQQQQVSQMQSVIQPRVATQLLQKNSLQPEQQLQLQQSVGSNFQLANTNVIQSPVLQQLRPNTLLTKVNVQQLKSPQHTGIRLANMNISQSYGENISRTGPQILAIRQQKSKSSQPSLENTEEDARLRQVVMASLLENNPEMFSRGQTVIGEIIRSQSTTQSFNTFTPDSLIESQQNESH